jgi:hypothetical protein
MRRAAIRMMPGVCWKKWFSFCEGAAIEEESGRRGGGVMGELPLRMTRLCVE